MMTKSDADCDSLTSLPDNAVVVVNKSLKLISDQHQGAAAVIHI